MPEMDAKLTEENGLSRSSRFAAGELQVLSICFKEVL